MISLRYMLSIVMIAACATSYAQSPTAPGPASHAEKAFDALKTLAGTWQGVLTTDNPAWSTDKPMHLVVRVASHGNALIHELDTGGPELTVFYVENNRLTLIHYCDFGNPPRWLLSPRTMEKR
jgi:hypothetical protein